MSGPSPSTSASAGDGVQPAAAAADAESITLSIVTIRNPPPDFDYSPFLRGEALTPAPEGSPAINIRESNLQRGVLPWETPQPAPSHHSASGQSVIISNTPLQQGSVPSQQSASAVRMYDHQGVSPQGLSQPGPAAYQLPATSHQTVSVQGSSAIGQTQPGPGAYQHQLPSSAQQPVLFSSFSSLAQQGVASMSPGHYPWKRGRGRPRKDPSVQLNPGIQCGLCTRRQADVMTRCEPLKHFYCRSCVVPLLNRMQCCPTCGQRCIDLDPI